MQKPFLTSVAAQASEARLCLSKGSVGTFCGWQRGPQIAAEGGSHTRKGENWGAGPIPVKLPRWGRTWRVLPSAAQQHPCSHLGSHPCLGCAGRSEPSEGCGLPSSPSPNYMFDSACCLACQNVKIGLPCLCGLLLVFYF